MNVDPLLKIVWQIAEIEARALGSRTIEPSHFLLGALKVVDLDFPNQLEELNLATDEWKSMCKDAVKVRHYLDVIPDKIGKVRRRLRHRLRRTANSPLSAKTKIHRSRKSCAAFFDAHCQLQNDTITLLQLMRSMFELDFLDVVDMRWRGLTQSQVQ